MGESHPATSLAGTKLDRYDHVCAFFRGRPEAYEILNPFTREGLEWGEKTLHITDPNLRADHRHRLQAAGIDIDIETPERTGQFEILTWEDAYLRGGRFDPDAMLAQLEDILLTSERQGYTRTRLLGHMEWALEDRPGVSRLLEYEARVTIMLAKRKGPAIRVYDLTRFGADVLVDIVRTHPMVLLGGVLRENPFFVPPSEFLAELRSRPGGALG
jgi:hypothetical protein